jgi:hypothetical protein
VAFLSTIDVLLEGDGTWTSIESPSYKTRDALRMRNGSNERWLTGPSG